MASTNLQKTIDRIASEARKAALLMQDVKVAKINSALLLLSKMLVKEKELIQKENRKDIAKARKAGLSSAMIDRLTITDKTIASMAKGLSEVAALKSPVGTEYDLRKRPNGLSIYKMRVPIGVVGIIYESRPNVTVDAAAICLKSLNSVILRGGSEAFNSNMVLTSLFSKALIKSGLPSEAVQLLPTTDRKAIELMLEKDDQIDLIIPRGGEGLIRMVVEKSRIPVIKHYKGVCHVYISSKADMKKAVKIAENAKIQRPGVCNAMETLLLDSSLPERSRKAVIQSLLDKKVVIYADAAARKLVPGLLKATEDDWRAEYLDLRLAVRTVKNIDEAIEHINTYGSHHTDSIITESRTEAEKFIKLVDSSSVMVNASTRFSDGGEYGMGCEIGISTDKLHARGPMGIEDLTTYKWIVKGNGQIRE
ncbi:MAG TPA: glutamate-5-semialdehyde dehydrogenase [Chitinispirillaceae bacterium]|jgi:glutamate-5-semialdehyde dehydrogenase|nr:glutamate-5-semialdehyde dehydrogenase [Chitinispirillaceae bacterium]